MACVYLYVPAGDIALAGDGADALGNNRFGSYVIVEGLLHTRQRLAVRLNFFAGEWFVDLRQGVPYYRDVFVKNPNDPLIRSLFRTVVLDTPGIISCPTLELVRDPATRRARVVFEAVSVDGVISVGPNDDDFLLPDAALAG